MSKESILAKIRDAIVEGEIPAVEAAGKEALDAGIKADVILSEGGNKGLDIVGEKFENLELFLPELIAASEAMKALNKIVFPVLIREQGGIAAKRDGAKVVFGTVQGDLHDMGKNLTITQLSLNGYEVFDLGTNVSVSEFFRAAEQHDAKIIAMSSLMTTSSYYQKDMVDYLKKVGKRDAYYVIVGGGIVTEEWAIQIGADGYGRTAVDAVTVCNMLLNNGEKPGDRTIHVFQGSTEKHGAAKTYYKEGDK